MIVPQQHASLARRHAALDADLRQELTRPLPDFMRAKRLKQLKLKLKDKLAASAAVSAKPQRAN